MDSGHERHTRPTATAVAAPTTSVPGPRSAPAVESAAPDITPVATAPAVDPTVDTGPIPAVVAPVVGPTLDTGPIPAVTGPATTTAPPATPTPVTHPCRCGHDRDAHGHFRRGSDCAACGCGRFRTPGLLARLRGQ